MHLEISDETSGMIQAALATDQGITSANDYIRSLVQEDQLARKGLLDSLGANVDTLEAMALEGLESGDPIPMDAEFWQKKRDHILNKYGNN